MTLDIRTTRSTATETAFTVGDGQPLMFDLDGVLVDSRGLHDRAFRVAVLKVAGIAYPDPPQWEEAAKTRTKLDHLKIKNPLMRKAVKRAKDAYFLATIDHVKCSQQIPATLNQLTNSIALVTSCSRDIMMVILNKTGLIEVKWRAIVSPESEDEKKDETYRRALKYARFDPLIATVFEDSNTGLEAARTAGLKDVREMHYHRLLDAFVMLQYIGKTTL